MKVVSNSYNILSIKLDGSFTTSSTTKVEGTAVDYEYLKRLAGKSGMLKFQAKLNDAIIRSTLSVNKDATNEKVVGIGFVENSGLNVVEAVFEPDTTHDQLKATVTAAAVTTT